MARPEWLSTELATGLAITMTAITAALGMPIMGPWVDHHGPHRLLLVSLLGTAAVLTVQALVPTIGLFLLLRGVMGIWLAGVTATLSVLTKLGAPDGKEGAAFGAAGSAQGLGWGLGPILGAGVVAVGGIPMLYLVCAVLALGLVVIANRTRPWPIIRGLGAAASPPPTTSRR
jgi:MFS family permease